MQERMFEYISLHRVRFAQPLNSNERLLDGPPHAAHWLSGPSSPIGEDGLRTRISQIWCGMGFYPSLAEAEKVLECPSDHLNFLPETLEEWHGLLAPYTHRGQTNWFGTLEAARQLRPLEADPKGPLVVMTSAGFDALPPEALAADMPRRKDFLANIDRVLDWFSTLPGNIVRESYQLGRPGTDGLTLTVWQSDEHMLEAAYRPGLHRTQLDRYKVEHTADRSSFTRARLVQSIGTWDGHALS